jgi:hypothetical protein
LEPLHDPEASHRHLGAGSIGCYVAARLLAAEAAEVVFVGRAQLRDASGASAPFNRRVVELIREAEVRGVGSPRLSPSALWERLTVVGDDPPATTGR